MLEPLFTQTNYGLAKTWLLQMGQGAKDNDLTIQYCMPWPRHYMQSLEVAAVTQTRITDDYHPGNTQWNIGDTVILAEALGLAAFKDVSGAIIAIHSCTCTSAYHIRTCTSLLILFVLMDVEWVSV